MFNLWRFALQAWVLLATPVGYVMFWSVTMYWPHYFTPRTPNYPSVKSLYIPIWLGDCQTQGWTPSHNTNHLTETCDGQYTQQHWVRANIFQIFKRFDSFELFDFLDFFIMLFRMFFEEFFFRFFGFGLLQGYYGYYRTLDTVQCKVQGRGFYRCACVRI